MAPLPGIPLPRKPRPGGGGGGGGLIPVPASLIPRPAMKGGPGEILPLALPLPRSSKRPRPLNLPPLPPGGNLPAFTPAGP